MRKTGIVRDNRYLEHNMGEGHPECPERLEAIYRMLDTEMPDRFINIPAREILREELLNIHTSEYIDKIAATDGLPTVYLDPDTQTSKGSYRAALLAAGGLCEAVRMVNAGELDNAFALVRPPGHHAERSEAMGFCLFNNVAIAAMYARKTLKLNRVLIADWDVHHGNGTQHSFERDDTILYFSTHQYPYYPGTGSYGEIGLGRGAGYTVNVPLPTGFGDGEFISIYNRVLKPIASAFRPELILVSAGFDIHTHDPLSNMNVTPQGFAGITRMLMDIADNCCNGRLVITLEGGYDIRGQRNSVKSVLEELSDIEKTDTGALMNNANNALVDSVLKPVLELFNDFWEGLK
ncbi:MAG: histone deacetylase [Deltaproteobacteria bacterium]|nr:histone deacetylase [Deltaproteobacteria bacterium]